MTEEERKQTIYYRMRMLNPGESFSVPLEKYATVRSNKGHLERDFDAHFIVTLTRNRHDPNCEVTVYMPTDTEWKEYQRMKQVRTRNSRYQKATDRMLYHWRRIKRLCEEDKIDPYEVLPKEFIRMIDEKNEENRNRLHGKSK